MTGNIQLPSWLVHVLAIVAAALVVFGTDKEFMALLPAWVATVAHPTLGLLTYLGISQVSTAPAK